MTFRKDINGLRAIAVLAVVLFHFKVIGFSGGFSGVDIFFVISGYLMTGIVFSKIEQTKFSLIDFYLHRTRRIIPALAFLCIALTIFGFSFLMTDDLREITKNIRKAILFVSNYTFYEKSGYFDTPSHENWLLHTWSLSVEWQFYLIYPLFILILRKILNSSFTKIFIILSAITSLFLSISYTPINPSGAFYLLPTRAWEMLVGGIVFLFPLTLSTRVKQLTFYIGLLLIILAVLLFTDKFLWPGYWAIIPVLGTMLIIWSNQNNLITNNLLSQWLGKVSYSIYLWHWPIAVLLLISDLLTNPFYKIIGILVSFTLGTLSYIFIERQFKLTHSRIIEIIKYIGIVLITIAIAASAGSLAKHQPQLRSKSLQDLNRIVENKYTAFSKKCLLSKNAPPSSECIAGKGELSIIILGDSHASVLFSTIEKANIKGASALWAMGGCPFIEDAKYTKRIYQGCNEFVPTRLKLLESNYPNIPVLISNQLTPYFNDLKSTMYFEGKNKTFEQSFRSSYISTMCKIAKNHPIYVVKPIPRYSFNIPKKIAINYLYGLQDREIIIPLSNYQSENKIILDIMEETSKKCGIELLDPTHYLCKDDICRANDGTSPLYFDDNHLSELGAMQLAPLFKNIFK